MFPERLTELRKREGLTQRELAKALHMSASAIGMYEAGKREPNFDTVEAIAAYFHVSASYLLGIEFNPEKAMIAAARETLSRDASDLVSQLRTILDRLPEDKLPELVNYARFLSQNSKD